MTNVAPEFAPFEPMPVLDPDGLLRYGGFAKLCNERQPAVLRAVAREWPMMNKWSPSYLSANMGDFECKIVRDSRPDLENETCTLEAYFRECAHLSTTTVVGLGPDGDYRFVDDISFPNPCFDRASLSAFLFFHAHAGDGAMPHCHEDAFNILVRGRKHWLLFDADPEISMVGWTLLKESLEEFGRGRHLRDWLANGIEPLKQSGIRVWQGVQEPGDVVYIPVRMAHAVVNLSECLGLVTLMPRPGVPYRKGPDGRYALPGLPEGMSAPNIAAH